jgi:hypothetical protein
MYTESLKSTLIRLPGHRESFQVLVAEGIRTGDSVRKGLYLLPRRNSLKGSMFPDPDPYQEVSYAAYHIVRQLP